MIYIISAVDSRDKSHGDYFKKDEENLVQIITGEHLESGHLCIESDKLNSAYIDIALPKKMEDKPHIFVVYTHGQEDSLICSGSKFVSLDNASSLKNTFVYSTACSCGKVLGPNLIEKGCRVFIGFEKSAVSLNCVDYVDISVNCDNSGIASFLIDDITTEECYNRMKKYYDYQISQLEKFKDVIFRAELAANKNSLVLWGDRNLTRKDFDV